MNTLNTIWVVDDNEADIMIAEQQIQSIDSRIQVISFQNARQALSQLRKPEAETARPDIIIVDLFMPVMDGWQFLQEYCQLPREVHQAAKVYVISSSMVPQDKDRASKIYPIADFITKPLTQQVLQKQMKIGS
jgi:CheY-like chemotaxis protein